MTALFPWTRERQRLMERCESRSLTCRYDYADEGEWPGGETRGLESPIPKHFGDGDQEWKAIASLLSDGLIDFPHYGSSFVPPGKVLPFRLTVAGIRVLEHWRSLAEEAMKAAGFVDA